MRPAEYDYEVDGGDKLDLVVRLKDETGAELDLTGFSSIVVITWPDGELRLSNGDRLEMAESNESPMSGTGSGLISGKLTGTETADFPFGRLTRFEWSYTDTSGDKQTFLKGFIVRL